MRPKSFRDRENPPYALPALFTAGTLFCGYYCLMKTVQAISLPAESADLAARLYDHASIAIGLAVFTDGLDGRVARATGAVSDFGREIDSLADCTTFGVAPATLAFAWGIRAPEMRPELWLGQFLPGLGYLVAFLFLLCGGNRDRIAGKFGLGIRSQKEGVYAGLGVSIGSVDRQFGFSRVTLDGQIGRLQFLGKPRSHQL